MCKNVFLRKGCKNSTNSILNLTVHLIVIGKKNPLNSHPQNSSPYRYEKEIPRKTSLDWIITTTQQKKCIGRNQYKEMRFDYSKVVFTNRHLWNLTHIYKCKYVSAKISIMMSDIAFLTFLSCQVEIYLLLDLLTFIKLRVQC